MRSALAAILTAPFRLRNFGTVLCDADAGYGYVNPAFAYTRSGAIYVPQQDGSLLSVAADTVPRAWDASLGWHYRVDPGFTNYFLNSTAQTSMFTNSAAAITDPSGDFMRKAVPLAISVSFPVVSAGAQGGSSSISLAQGAAQDFWYYGYIGPSIVGSLTLEPNFIIQADLSGGSPIYAQLQVNTSNGTQRFTAYSSGFSELQAPTFTAVGGGVYFFSWGVRLTQDATLRNTITNYCQIKTSALSGSYTGDGVSGIQFSKINCVRASYQPPITNTTTAAVTIGNPSWSASLASLGLSLTGDYSMGAEYFTSAKANSYPTPQSVLRAQNAGNTERMILSNTTGASAGPDVEILTGGATTIPLARTSFMGQRVRMAGRVSAPNCAAAINGNVGTTSLAANPTAPTLIALGQNGSGSVALAGGIKSAWIAPQALNDAYLRALTA